MLKYEFMEPDRLFAFRGWDDLVREYIEETANPAIGAAEPQFDRYRELYAAGRLKLIAASDEGEICGVAALLAVPTQHYPFPIVSTEAVFLRKPWRKGYCGLHLLRLMKVAAEDMGSPGLTFQAPPGSQMDKVCERLGMTHTHNIWWWGKDD